VNHGLLWQKEIQHQAPQIGKRMRLFVALDIDEAIRQRVQRFLEGVRGFAPDARWVGPDAFHITLKFIGEQPPQALGQVRQALGEVHGAPATIDFRGYGFFPSPRAARVFWVGMEGDANLAALAAAVEAATAALGIPREQHEFAPHLTLARAGSGRPYWKSGDRVSSVFQHLQEKLAALEPPDFGTMTAREFFLYESKLSPTGARYTKLERFVLAEPARI
jgi:2'-5' RNA ligase